MAAIQQDQFEETFGKVMERTEAERTIKDLARFPSENPNPVLRISADGKLLYANQAALTQFSKWNLKLNKQVPEELKALAGQVNETREVQTEEIPIGNKIYSIAATPTPEDYINLYALDVTERVKAEEKIKATNEELQKLVNAMVGRELKMKELKERIKKLEKKIRDGNDEG